MYQLSAIGPTISEGRRRAGLTQGDFAAALGVSPQAVSKWETGAGYPDIALLPEIARLLGITVDALFRGELPAEDDALAHHDEGKGPLEAVAQLHGDAEPEDAAPGGFPLQRGRLWRVAVWQQLACYASSRDVEVEGPIVVFSDESRADLRTRSVINHGRFEIVLVGLEDLHAERAVESRSADGWTAASGPLCGLELVLKDAADIHIEPAGNDAEAWSWRFEGELAPLRELDVAVVDGRLRVALSLNQPAPRLRHMSAALYLRVPAQGLQQLRATLNGAGDLHCQVDCGEARIEQNGAGDIHLTRCERLDISIRGAGDLHVDYVGALDCELMGACDVRIGELGGGDMRTRIRGAADIVVDAGRAGAFEIEIGGAGDLRAPTLVVDTAYIRIGGPGSVELGRIIGRSEERLGILGSLRVHARGPEGAYEG